MATKKKLGSSKPKKTTKEKKTENVMSEVPKFDYHLEVYLNNEVHKADTNDLYQALLDYKNGPFFPSRIKTEVLFKYSKGEVFREKVFHRTIDATRLFGNDLSLELLAKQMTKEVDG